MNRNSRRIGIYVTLSLILTVAAVALRCAACIKHLNIYGYFDDTTFITVAAALIWGGAVISLSYGVVGLRISLRPSFSSPATFVPTGIVGAALFFFALRMLKSARELYLTGGRVIATVTAVLCAILALLSIVHFFLNSYLTESRAELRAYFATATVLVLASYATYLYFAGGQAINAPNRITDQMAYLFSALFFLYETRISLGREKWRAYTVFGLIAASMCAYSSIPALVLYFAKDTCISASLEESILTLSLFIFILMRLILTVSLPEAEKNKRITALESFAEERAREVTDTERRYEEAYAVQLTIEDLIPSEEMPETAPEEEVYGEEFVFPTDEEPTTVFMAEEEPDDDGQIELISDIFAVADEITEDTENNDEPEENDSGDEE